MVHLTQNEVNILASVCFLQIEEGLSEYTEVSSPNEKGILGSLVKKGLVYNCHEGEPFYMYCLTNDGLETCKKLGIKTEHIHFFNL